MHFRPGFRLDVPGTDVTFGLNAFYDYVWYTGLISDTSAPSHSEAGADMHAEINREGVVEFDVADASPGVTGRATSASASPSSRSTTSCG